LNYHRTIYRLSLPEHRLDHSYFESGYPWYT